MKIGKLGENVKSQEKFMVTAAFYIFKINMMNASPFIKTMTKIIHKIRAHFLGSGQWQLERQTFKQIFKPKNIENLIRIFLMIMHYCAVFCTSARRYVPGESDNLLGHNVVHSTALLVHNVLHSTD